MESDSRENWSDLDRTYQAFSSDDELPAGRPLDAPGATQERTFDGSSEENLTQGQPLDTPGASREGRPDDSEGDDSGGRSYDTPGSTLEQPPSPRGRLRRESAPSASYDSEDSLPVDQEGIVFGKFRMLRKLGGGGMGAVWLVEHIVLEKELALKVIKSQVAENPINLERFRREARILARLNEHPNAVPVYDADIEGKFAYIAMTYLQGQTLKQRLDDNGPMPPRDVAWFLDEFCSVLGAAHQLQIVHRDIKPHNIMIVPDPSSRRGERVKALDFGIAKIIKDPALDTASMTLQTEGYLGTYPYSSPEQLGLPLPGHKDAAPVDLRSDIYSLGVVLYEMLVGIRPFSGVATKILYDHVHTPPPSFANVAPDVQVHPAIEAVVNRCLEKDPANRPGSAAELARMFRQAVIEAGELEPGIDDLETDPTTGLQRARSYTSPSVVEVEEEEKEPEPSLTPPPPDFWRAHRRKILGAAGGVGAAALLIAAFFFNGNHEDRHKLVDPKPPEPPSPQAAAWLTQAGFEKQGDALLAGWPSSIRRKDGDKRQYRLPDASSTCYLPAGYRPEQEAGVGKDGLPKVIISEQTGRRFLLIEGGEFVMGAFDDRHDFDETEKPGHMVRLSSFYMQEHEVTIDEFRRFCEDRPSLDDPLPLGDVGAFNEARERLRKDNPGLTVDQSLNYPATGVTHRLAERYAHEAGGELPSEAQREFAARSAGKNQLYPWGDDKAGLSDGPDKKANVDSTFTGGLAPVSQWVDDRSDQGILGLTGNAREWCRDVWQNYNDSEPGTDPVVLKPRDGETPHFVIRGGSYLTQREMARATWRRDTPELAYKAKEDEGFQDVGFRMVLEVLRRPAPSALAANAKTAIDPEAHQ